ncbi:hypothetical protein SEA_BAILEYBLU_47 [Arthrobacter phage BaileyBlu]|uniref:Uncharacterized protein n=1 Tax=Arthrobacter phage BaileyBlu TaxID=2910754 RepID=A0AA49BPD9_9CAUD|nr:hypothetical protein PQD78_gp47 [Arthrobacter phage BaileyBlu]UJQ87185.1 hypothetical protein SEA_BAILEYBLU_47 [Arthrobacter phage BaileyBlu]
MATIEAHGKSYATRAEAEARIEALVADNRRFGDSDGRVTEIDAITEALVAHHEATTPAIDYAHREKMERIEREAATLRRARAELAGLARHTPGDGRIDYMDKHTGRRRVARYTTRDGFLRAWIDMVSRPQRYALYFVDEA